MKEALEWLDDNPAATVDDYKDKLKELEGVTNPIVTKLYSAGGAPGGGGMPDMGGFGGEDDLPDHDDL